MMPNVAIANAIGGGGGGTVPNDDTNNCLSRFHCIY